MLQKKLVGVVDSHQKGSCALPAPAILPVALVCDVDTHNTPSVQQVGAPRWLSCIVTTWGITAMAFAFSEYL